MSRPKKLKDKDVTELDWFLLELFCRNIFGSDHQVSRPGKKIKKPIAANTMG